MHDEYTFLSHICERFILREYSWPVCYSLKHSTIIGSRVYRHSKSKQERKN